MRPMLTVLAGNRAGRRQAAAVIDNPSSRPSRGRQRPQPRVRGEVLHCSDSGHADS